MTKVGEHITLDIIGTTKEYDPSVYEKVIHEIAKAAKVTILNISKYKFEPQGFTILALLAESHISFHTFPEKGIISFDFFTCGKIKPSVAVDIIKKEFNHKRIVKKGTNVFVFLEISDETGLIDVSVPVELHDEKKPLFKENSVVMIKGTVVADDYRRGNFEDVGIKIRATDVMPIEIARKTVTSKIQLDVSRKQLKELGNGKFDELKSLNDPDGIDVVLNLKDEDLNISSEVKVDTFKISLEDSTFEKINELFGEENYKLF